ncbi:MAG: ATP-binding protein [Aquabacterium sp.]|nr:ATP-binding protein [Aquabacterium sp.]
MSADAPRPEREPVLRLRRHRRQAPAGRPWSLLRQLRRQLLALLALVWLVASLATGLGLWHETDEVLDSALAETAQRLLMLPPAALAEPDTAERLAMLGAHEEFVVYQLFDASGALLLQSHRAPGRRLDPRNDNGLRRAGDWWVLTLAAPDGQRRAQVAESVAHRHEVMWASMGWMLGMLALLLPAAAWLVDWLLRRAFATLEPARHDLAARLSHDLRPVQPGTAPAELQPWLDTVNGLLARVGDLVDSERAFAANTAHELRTPLAAARAQAERLVQASHDPAAREAAQALLRQLDRLAHLATRLLELARVESGVALRREPVDLVQLAVLVVDDFSKAQRSGRLQLRVLGLPTPVQGDIDALGIALRNLIDNALRHGGDTARVTVRVQGQSISVEDDGPGVPPDELPVLVRKFQRGEAGRGVAGSGLGLALVQAIAQQSGARLVLQSPVADGHGFGASLQFDAGADAAVDPKTGPAPL